MKIVVLSDTHSKDLPKQLLDELKTVDLILHAGDLCSVEDYESLLKIAKTEAVCGNMDCHELKTRLPKRKIITCEFVNIGLYHGRGSAVSVFNTVKEEFENDDVNVVVFGHSHQPFNEEIDNVLYFNPGSPNDIVFAPYLSYGILQISGKEVSGRIVKVDIDNG